MKKLISIITPTYNEEENIEKLCSAVKNELNKLNYEYEHICIDNSSTDKTIEKLREIASKDKNVKVILNAKNFGHIRSPIYGLFQSSGDAAIIISCDFQDPIELIPKLIEKWEKGSLVVLGKKISSGENELFFFLRKFYYSFLKKISDANLTENTTGFGIIDKSIVEKLKTIEDPYPYLRGLLSELTDNISTVDFHQPKRLFGKTKNNFFTLYDIGMLGLIKHSQKPLKLMTLVGFISSLSSLLIALGYLFYKIIFWNSFDVGVAPIVIGIFAIGSIQIFLLGLIGEYVGIVLIHQRKLPLVVEKERINF